MIHVKRAYERKAKPDGLRIFVERTWPRNLSKQQASIDLWLRELAPTVELQKWFDHEPTKWSEFCRRYAEELRTKPDLIALLAHRASEGPVTLVYAAREQIRNSALALKEYLEKQQPGAKR